MSKWKSNKVKLAAKSLSKNNDSETLENPSTAGETDNLTDYTGSLLLVMS